jgi:hypothetical protein
VRVRVDVKGIDHRSPLWRQSPCHGVGVSDDVDVGAVEQ